jgi:molecular chaperone IbpA
MLLSEDMEMRTADFAPLYRSTVGFDRMFDLLNAASQPNAEDNWPPCDIEAVGEDRYLITMAVAGFTPDELSITAQANELLVEGRKAEDQGRRFLHRGIPQSPFRRRFELADFVKVVGASYENGLLAIELQREVPEAMKPKRIAIVTPAAQQAPREEQRLKRAGE